jgi:hypothetical protein
MSDDTTNRIDDALNDYTRQRQPDDATAMDGLNNIMAEAMSIMKAARIAGFTEEQALQHSRDYTIEVWRALLRAMTQG